MSRLMSSLLRWRPSLFRLGRARQSIRIHETTIPQPENIRLQRVKFKSRWPRAREIIGPALVLCICYEIYTQLVFGLLEPYLHPAEEMTDEELDELERTGPPPLIIGLPLTTREVEPVPYKGTDPEWRMFAKISRDRKLLNTMKADLADLIRKAALSSPLLVHNCGKDMTVQRSWLDVVYPTKPFPTFERKVIFWGNTSIGLATQTIPSATAFQISRVLYPSAVTVSLWTFGASLLQHNLQGTARYLGFGTNSPADDQKVLDPLDRLRRQMGAPQPKSESKDQLASKKTQSADGSTASTDKPSAGAPPSSPMASPPGGGTKDPSAGPPREKVASAKEMVGIREMSEHTTGPYAAFKAKFRQVWRPLQPYPARGSIQLTGLVELNSPRAILTIEVWAWYDPVNKKFDHRSMVLRLKHLRRKQMAPPS